MLLGYSVWRGKRRKKKGVDDFTGGLEYREAAVGSDIDADNMQMLRKKTGLREKF